MFTTSGAPPAVVWLHSTGALGESASRGNAILIETAAPLFGVGKTRLFWLQRAGSLRFAPLEAAKGTSSTSLSSSLCSGVRLPAFPSLLDPHGASDQITVEGSSGSRQPAGSIIALAVDSNAILKVRWLQANLSKKCVRFFIFELNCPVHVA